MTQTSRKEFIKLAGGTLAMMSTMTIINGCAGITRKDFNNEKKKLNSLTQEEIRILYLAGLAPSGHNTQPWTVKIKKPGTWIIGSAKDRWLPAVDPENREMMLSIGAFIENLVTAAEINGYHANVDVTAKSNMDKKIAEIKLTKDKPVSYPEEKITLRRTVKNGHQRKELSLKDLNYLKGENGEHIRYYPFISSEGKYL